MEKIKKQRTHKKLYTFLLYVLTLYIIYATDSLFFSTNIQKNIVKFSQYGIIVLTFFMFFYYLVERKPKADFFLLILLCSILVIGMIATGDYTGGYFLKIFLFLFSFLFFQCFESEDFVKAYLNWMKIIAVVSLLAYAVGNFVSTIPFLPKITSVVGRNYISFVFTNVPEAIDLRNRNYGPFWEPGVYQGYLIVALMFSLFYKKKQTPWEILLYSITIVTTYSTTGITALAAVMAAYLLTQQKGKKNFQMKCFLALIGFAGILYIANNQEIWDLFFAKVEMGTESASFSSRWNAIAGNLTIAFQYPFFGAGPNRTARLIQEYVKTVNQTGTFFNVNTILVHFSVFGILIGIYFVWKVFLFAQRLANKWILTELLLLVAFVMILSGENLVYSLFFNLIFFCGPPSFSENTQKNYRQRKLERYDEQ